MSEPNSKVLPEAALSEAEFLKRQSEQAQAAIGHALAGAKKALAEGVDPREWTRKYPLIAIGAAAVAGFAAATAAIPSKREQELRRLREIHEAMNPPPAKPAEASGNGKSSTAHSWFSTLMHEGLALIRPILTSFVVANLTPPAGAGEDGYGTDGTAPGDGNGGTTPS